MLKSCTSKNFHRHQLTWNIHWLSWLSKYTEFCWLRKKLPSKHMTLTLSKSSLENTKCSFMACQCPTTWQLHWHGFLVVYKVTFTRTWLPCIQLRDSYMDMASLYQTRWQVHDLKLGDRYMISVFFRGSSSLERRMSTFAFHTIMGWNFFSWCRS